MKLFKSFLTAALLAICTGCATQGNFVVPQGSKLYLDGRAEPEQIAENGKVSTRPFTWRSSGLPPQRGVAYRLEKDGQTIKEGKLRAVFRGASLFWPPVVGVLVAPIGLNPHIKYDLVNDKQE